MSRVLSMTERRVDGNARAAYIAALQTRRDSATAVHAHFWVFEDMVEQGRFMEFTEAASDDAIRLASGDNAPMVLWREVQGV